MAQYIVLISSLLSAYLIGSIPTSFILAKVLIGIDIRRHGSGNVGATNIFRVVGKLPGIIALVIDILKGVLVVTLIANFFYSFLKNFDYELYRTIMGFVAICGHIWPIFLRFKGGKGIATTIGVLIVIAPMILGLSLGMWLILFLVTRYVSLASIALVVSLPIFAIFFKQSFSTTVFAVIICGLTSYRHKDNIKRLIKGEENRVMVGKKVKA